MRGAAAAEGVAEGAAGGASPRGVPRAQRQKQNSTETATATGTVVPRGAQSVGRRPTRGLGEDEAAKRNGHDAAASRGVMAGNESRSGAA